MIALANGPTLDIYLPGGKLVNQLTVSPAVAALAFSPDGNTLYAVTEVASGEYSLRVIQQPAPPRSRRSP